MRKSTIYGLMTARHQREQGWSFLRNNDGGGDDGGTGGGTDDSGGQGDGGGTDDDPQGDGKKDDDLANLSQADLAKMVRDLRKEAGSARTTAKQQAADKAKADLVQQLGKALGLVKDGDGKPDVAKLTETLTSRETALREATAENAVLKLAARNGGDGDALTDSREFMARVSKLDQSADNFRSKVGDAIKKFVADNPRYAAAGSSTSASGGPIKNGAPSAKDDKARGVDRLRNAYQTQ
ncbi:hypothetical protein SUDANB95_05511 [Actinosynnema sp. ALI-1.44]